MIKDQTSKPGPEPKTDTRSSRVIRLSDKKWNEEHRLLFRRAMQIDFEGIVPATAPDNEAYRYFGDGFEIRGVRFFGMGTVEGKQALWVVEPRYDPQKFDWGYGAVVVAREGGNEDALRLVIPAASSGGVSAVQFSVATDPPGEEIKLLSDPAQGDPYEYYETYTDSLAVIRLPGILIVTIGFKNPNSNGATRQLLVDNVFVWD